MMFRVKQVEKEKSISDTKRGDGELEMFLNETPYVQSLNRQLHRQNNHHRLMNVSPISSCSSSSALCSSDDCFSPYLPTFDETMYQTPSTHHLDSRFLKNSNGYTFDDHGLSEKLHRMHIGDGYEHKGCSRVRQSRVESDGFGFREGFVNGVSPPNSENYCSVGAYKNGVYDYEGIQSSFRGCSTSFDDDTKSNLLGLGQGYNVGNSCVSDLTHKNRLNYLLKQRDGHGRSYFNNGVHLQSPSMNMPYLNDEFYGSQQFEVDSNGDMGVLNPLNSSPMMHSNMGPSGVNPRYNRSMLNKNTRQIPNGEVPPSRLPMADERNLEGFSCEDSFIIQGKSLKYADQKGRDRSKGRKKSSHYEIAMANQEDKLKELQIQSKSRETFEIGLNPPPFCSLAEVMGNIYYVAKDQLGCRFLQRIFDEGTRQDVEIIFSEIINHVAELMMNPFGNYLIQKLFDVCSEEQRMEVVLMVTEDPKELVRISLNAHGTRVVQKLIESLKTRQQISLVISALKPGILDLSKDLNGNHVVQRCLQCLGKEDNKFIFEAATKYCVDIATHRHGCCVLNRCIAHSTGKHREKLVAEIAANGLHLSQDAFGNYVIQYIIELKFPSVAASLISQFEGNYVYLSMQKFSSHVVEKCLKFIEESQSRIIHEFLSVYHFEQLLQDPFANYVIQSALEVTKGPLHALLVEAVRPHNILRTSPYCKKIFSRNLLKK